MSAGALQAYEGSLGQEPVLLCLRPGGCVSSVEAALVVFTITMRFRGAPAELS